MEFGIVYFPPLTFCGIGLPICMFKCIHSYTTTCNLVSFSDKTKLISLHFFLVVMCNVFRLCLFGSSLLTKLQYLVNFSHSLQLLGFRGLKSSILTIMCYKFLLVLVLTWIIFQSFFFYFLCNRWSRLKKISALWFFLTTKLTLPATLICKKLSIKILTL